MAMMRYAMMQYAMMRCAPVCKRECTPSPVYIRRLRRCALSCTACNPCPRCRQVRVYHDNSGQSPSWFLEEVRVRRTGSGSWTAFPCQRWLAVDEDDG